MAGPTFQTNPVDLYKLLEKCHDGIIQLPDFQRSWVWDEDRIKSLIASISCAFPIGTLMSLNTGGSVNFKPRPVEGAPTEAHQTDPQSLLLDGQQRMTSLYQATLRGKVIETVTLRNKRVKRWFYIDIAKAIDHDVDREEAVIGVPEDRVERVNFGREIKLNLSTPEKEYRALMYPVSQVFDWDKWQDGFNDYWAKDERKEERKQQFRTFKNDVLDNFKMYRVPVIALDRETSRDAVCVVFEKVNTGGKPLDAFELVTAMYAAGGYELRKDWYGGDGVEGREQRLANVLRMANAEAGILGKVGSTDFLQVVSLFYTRERRRKAEQEGKKGNELPKVSGTRHELLGLPLDAYKRYQAQVECGFIQAAKFLHELYIYQTLDLPYQQQIVPLAAILADIGDAWQHEANRQKLVQWYWNGVFGELYGSAAESRTAHDFMEVPAWLKGGSEPLTVSEAIFRADRLKTMRRRASAAYKGVNALLMRSGAEDFRSGQKFSDTVFFDEHVDIHHVFPQAWCKARDIGPEIFDSIINKTPLSERTNRIIGGVSPSEYLGKLEHGNSSTPSISPSMLDGHLKTHLIDPNLLREDKFEAFMEDRQQRLLRRIEEAMGKSAYSGDVSDGSEGDEAIEDGSESALTLSISDPA